MTRWEPGAKERLQAAALELFAARGFEQTTAAEIAQSVGLTERTFFRHFSDKREVLFYGQRQFLQAFADGADAAPPDASPLEVIASALHAAAALFPDDRRPYSRMRQSVIDQNPPLQEREQHKSAGLAATVAVALRTRGIGEPAATLAAQTGATVFGIAFAQWIREGETRSLGEIASDVFRELLHLTAPRGHARLSILARCISVLCLRLIWLVRSGNVAASDAEGQWNFVRESVRATTGRFCELVASVPHPAVRASARWSVADITAHVATISFLNTMLMRIAEPPFQMPGLTEVIAATTVDTVHGLNDQVMSHFPERDVSRLLDMLRHHVDLMLMASQDHDPAETFSWLGEARPTLAGMFAHMVNELLIHGNDIASAVKVPWAMPAEDAALFFDLFYVGLANGQQGRLLEGSKRPLRRRIAVEFRSGYTAPVTIVVRDGRVTAEPPGPGADARVRFDPATLNMMMFGRISKAQAVLTRKIIISGRRPWLMSAFLRTVRLPS